MTDEPGISEFLAQMRSARERTREVGRQLVGLTLHDAAELAAQSDCQLRVIRRDGKGGPVTADFATNRIDVEVQGDIVVQSSPS
jgi:hypothetical protein